MEESLNVLLRDAAYPGIAEHREDMFSEVAANSSLLTFGFVPFWNDRLIKLFIYRGKQILLTKDYAAGVILPDQAPELSLCFSLTLMPFPPFVLLGFTVIDHRIIFSSSLFKL